MRVLSLFDKLLPRVHSDDDVVLFKELYRKKICIEDAQAEDLVPVVQQPLVQNPRTRLIFQEEWNRLSAFGEQHDLRAATRFVPDDLRGCRQELKFALEKPFIMMLEDITVNNGPVNWVFHHADIAPIIFKFAFESRASKFDLRGDASVLNMNLFYISPPDKGWDKKLAGGYNPVENLWAHAVAFDLREHGLGAGAGQPTAPIGQHRFELMADGASAIPSFHLENARRVCTRFLTVIKAHLYEEMESTLANELKTLPAYAPYGMKARPPARYFQHDGQGFAAETQFALRETYYNPNGAGAAGDALPGSMLDALFDVKEMAQALEEHVSDVRTRAHTRFQNWANMSDDSDADNDDDSLGIGGGQ